MLNFHLKEDWKSLATLITSVRDINRLISSKNPKIYISLTSSPLRLKNIPLMLSFLDLTHVYEIHINLPKYYRNKKGEVYKQKEIDYIQSLDSRIKVYRIDKDIGPITKILPTLKRVKNNKAIIISVDDDIGYPRSIINELVYYTYKNPKVVWGGEGFNFGDYEGSDFDRRKWPKGKTRNSVDILEGWASIAYPKWLITSKMLKRMELGVKLSTDCKLSDDLIISEALAYYKIPRKVIHSDYYEELPIPFEYGLGADALHKGSGVGGEKSDNVMDENMAKYDRCLNNFK